MTRALRLPRGMRHAIWSLADTAAYPVLYMAAVPLLIRYMGPVVFGFWIVLNTVIIVLQLFNFNLGFTALRHIAHEQATGNNSLVKDMINGLLRITFLQLAGVLLIGGLLSLVIASTDWLGGYATSFRHGAICFTLAALLAGFKYFEQLFQNIIKAYELFRSAAILNMISRIGSLLLTIMVAAQYRGNILYVLSANAVFSLAYLVLHYAFICQALPFYKAGRVQDTGIRKRLLSYSMWPWVQLIMVVLTFQADRFWVSGFAGLKEVSGYGLVATMFNHIHMIFMALVAWVLPRMIAMHARGDDTKELYTTIHRLLTTITLVSLLLFYAVSPVIFRLWVGAATYESMKWYIRGFTAFELVYVHTILPFYFMNGTGRERRATYATLLYCGAAYVLMIGGLIWLHDPAAMVMGMTLGVGLTIPLFNSWTRQYMQRSNSWPEVLMELVPVYAAIVLVYIPPSWLMAVMALVLAITLWKYYLSHLLNRSIWMQVFRR